MKEFLKALETIGISTDILICREIIVLFKKIYYDSKTC